MSRLPNPVRLTILWISLGLARLGLVDAERGRRTVDLAWPRVVTGVARMSKAAADVAMVGVAVGPAAIAGVGFAGPYWSVAFTTGGGLAAGTIALVSQRFRAGADAALGQAVRSSVLLVVAVSLPIAALYWFVPTGLIALLSNDAETVRLGAAYLQVLAVGVPFAAVNLVGSRMLVGADDAWTPMVVRAGGAVANVALNALFIFGLGMGVVGAASGTVLSNVAVTAVFAVGLARGRVPLVGELPISVRLRGRYVDPGTMRDLASIGLPVIGRRTVWMASRFPMLAIVALFGPTVVAGYVISRRIYGIMGTPGWGFGLAASSLVGQSLGGGDEETAAAYGREIVRIAVLTYVVAAAAVAVFAVPIVELFVDDPASPAVPVAVALVYAACLSVLAQGVSRTIAGALDSTGDTRWPFYSRVVGMFGVAIPLAYVGATTSLGLWGLYLAYVGQTVVPAAVNYHRFSTGRWRAISRRYRPAAAAGED